MLPGKLYLEDNMRTRYYYCFRYRKEVYDVLEECNIPSSLEYGLLSFSIYTDEECFTKIRKMMEGIRDPLTFREFSKEELDGAQWLLMRSKCGKISTGNEEYTFSFTCPYAQNPVRYHHIEQVAPYLLYKPIKWKNRNNFYSDDCGDFYTIFCSSHAKSVLSSFFTGICYDKVLKKDGSTAWEDIFQLRFTNILPLEALMLPASAQTIKCPSCGRVEIDVLEPEEYLMKLNRDVFDGNGDIFATPSVFGPGATHPYYIVSQRFRQIILENLQERNMVFVPIQETDTPSEWQIEKDGVTGCMKQKRASSFSCQ